jgi:hypothetical protein
VEVSSSSINSLKYHHLLNSQSMLLMVSSRSWWCGAESISHNNRGYQSNHPSMPRAGLDWLPSASLTNRSEKLAVLKSSTPSSSLQLCTILYTELSTILAPSDTVYSMVYNDHKQSISVQKTKCSPQCKCYDGPFTKYNICPSFSS